MLWPLVTAVLDGLVELPVRISKIGDSECTILPFEAENSVLAHFFRNRVGEILEHMVAWPKQPGPTYQPVERLRLLT